MRLGYTECPGCGIHVGNGDKQLHDASATHKAASRLRVLRAQKKPAWLSALSVVSPTATPAPAGGVPPPASPQEAAKAVRSSCKPTPGVGSAPSSPQPAASDSASPPSPQSSPLTQAPRVQPPAARPHAAAADHTDAAAAPPSSLDTSGMTKRQRKQAEIKLAMQEKSAKRAEAKRLREAAAAAPSDAPASAVPGEGPSTDTVSASPASRNPGVPIGSVSRDTPDAAATAPSVRNSIMEAVLARFAQRPRS